MIQKHNPESDYSVEDDQGGFLKFNRKRACDDKINIYLNH